MPLVHFRRIVKLFTMALYIEYALNKLHNMLNFIKRYKNYFIK